MRVSLRRWAMAILLCGGTVMGVGCKSGTSSQPAGGWLSWGKKQDSSTALAATRPSTQSQPLPAQTAGSGPAVAANAGANPYPGTTTPGAGYTAIPVNGAAGGTDAQRAGYFTGPYNTGATQPQPGAPAGAAPGAPRGGAAPGYGAPANSDIPAYSADRRAGGYPTTATPSASGYSPYGAAAPGPGPGAPAGAGYNAAPAGGGYAPGGYAPNNNAPAGAAPSGYAPPGGTFGGQGVAPASVPANGGGGQFEAEPAHAHQHDSQPSGVVPASPYAARDGGYRPGSTGRNRSFDQASQTDNSAVRPAGYNGYGSPGGSFQP